MIAFAKIVNDWKPFNYFRKRIHRKCLKKLWIRLYKPSHKTYGVFCHCTKKQSFFEGTLANVKLFANGKLRKKCPYLEFFCSVFSLIQTEYGEIRHVSRYSVRMRENTDQKNSEYRHFLRSRKCFNLFVSSRSTSYSK